MWLENIMVDTGDWGKSWFDFMASESFPDFAPAGFSRCFWFCPSKSFVSPIKITYISPKIGYSYELRPLRVLLCHLYFLPGFSSSSSLDYPLFLGAQLGSSLGNAFQTSECWIRLFFPFLFFFFWRSRFSKTGFVEDSTYPLISNCMLWLSF